MSDSKKETADALRLQQILDSIAETKERINDATAAHSDHLQAQIDLISLEEDALNAVKEKNKAIINEQIKSGEMDEQKIKDAQEAIDLADEEIAKNREINKEKLKRLKNDAKLAKHGEKMLETATGIGNAWEDTVWGSVVTNPPDMGGMAGALSAIGQGMASMINPGNIGGSMLMKLQESICVG